MSLFSAHPKQFQYLGLSLGYGGGGSTYGCRSPRFAAQSFKNTKRGLKIGELCSRGFKGFFGALHPQFRLRSLVAE